MAVLAILLYLLAFVVGIGSLVCFVMVVVQMFKHDQTGLGIACIVLTLLWNRRVDRFRVRLDEEQGMEPAEDHVDLDGVYRGADSSSISF